MTLADARRVLVETFSMEPEALLEQTVIALVPGANVPLPVKFVGLVPDERGDWVAVVRPGAVVDLYLVHPSRLSRVP